MCVCVCMHIYIPHLNLKVARGGTFHEAKQVTPINKTLHTYINEHMYISCAPEFTDLYLEVARGGTFHEAKQVAA